jgi:hypothetical protein
MPDTKIPQPRIKGEIETSLDQWYKFKESSMYRDLQRFWEVQLETTKDSILVEDDVDMIRTLQGMGIAQEQGLNLVDAFITYLRTDA